MLLALDERERIDRLLRRADEVRAARLTNYALAAQGTHDDALAVEARAVERSLGLSPHDLGAGRERTVTEQEEDVAARILRVIYRGASDSTGDQSPPVS